MNKYQRAYAVAKAHHDTITELYYSTLAADAYRQALLTEEESIIELDTPESNARCLEIEGLLMDQEAKLDAQVGRTTARDTLKIAENAMVEWGFSRLRRYPEAFAMVGASYSDIESLKSATGKIRERLIELTFRYAG